MKKRYLHYIAIWFSLPYCGISYGEEISLTSQQAISRALKQSHQLKARHAERDVAAAQAQGAVSSFLPTLDLKLTGGTYRSHELTDPTSPDSALREADYNRYQGKLELRQPIFHGFQNYHTLRATQAVKNAADLTFWDQQDAIIRRGISLYFGIQLHLEELKAENEVREQRTNYLRDIKHMLDQGRSTKLFYLQAEYAVRAQIPIIKKIEAELASKRVELFRLLDISLDTQVSLTESLEQGFAAAKAMRREPIEEMYRIALEHNRQILLAKNQLKKVEAQASAIQARHFPHLDLVMSANVDARYRESIKDKTARSYAAELQLTIPLFSGFEAFATRAERIALREQASESLLATEQDLLTLVKDLDAKWTLNLTVLEAEEANLKLAEESIKSAENLFQVGRATVTDVLDSYSRKLAAKRTIASIKYDHVLLAMDIRTLKGATVYQSEGK